MTGIASDAVIEQYVEHIASTAVSSMSADQRADQLMQEINALLAQEGVPPVPHDFGAGGDDYGYFAPSDWKMSLNRTYFDESAGHDATTLETNYREALRTVFHEARHAEQSFRAMREVFGLGATVEQALHAMSQATGGYPPPAWVANLAHQNPILQCDVAQNEAAQWYETLYGSGAAHHAAAESNASADPSSYMRLPDEADAWAADTRVGDVYNQHMHPQQHPQQPH
jgi:hypothetical protein